MAGCILSGSRISLEFPNRLGWFKGNLLPSGEIDGHWIQPSGTFVFGQYASPVKLKMQAKGRWAGDVKPLDDVATIYLNVKKTPDDKLSAYIRNPERNVGLFWNAKQLIQDSNGVRLMGANDGVAVETARGLYDKGNDTLALYFPFRAMSFTFTRATKNPLSGFYPRPVGERMYKYRVPTDSPDGWKVASASSVGLSIPSVEQFVQSIIETPDDSVHSLNTHSVLLARHGKLVLEEYFHGYNGEMTHDLRSASKSLTSILAGIAMQESASLNLKSPVVQILKQRFPIVDNDPRKDRITVENLLTMSAGLDCDDDRDSSPGNEDTMQSQQKDLDWYHYSISVPMVYEPGAKAVYGSALPNLLGGVIASDRKVWLPEFFHDRIAKPLGMENYYLPITPTGDAYMGGGFQLTPRDFLKLGQMMLDGGTWKGKQILNKAYVKESSKPRYELAGIQYGFLWWVTDYRYRGKSIRAFFAGGNGGQVVEVVPELSLVFCCNAGNYGDSGTFIPQREWIPKFVLPMIQPRDQ